MNGKIKVNDSLARILYERMLRIRVVEEELASFYREQEMRCPVHFCIGQEAVAVGVSACLDPGDTIMSTHRSHGHYLAAGGDLRGMVAEFYGKRSGCASGKGGSMHLIDLSVNFLGATSIVSGTIPVATGVGFASQMAGKDSVSVVFFGDAATEEGTFYESLNFAALKALPVLYVCENNQYSTLSPIHKRQPASRKIYRVARSMGVKSLKVNGNNVEGVYRTTRSCIEAVRNGEGPFLIEAMTYRYLEHCGPNYDHEQGFRSEEEVMAWMARDPVKTQCSRLLKEGLITQTEISVLRQKFRKEIHDAVEYAKGEPYPDPSEVLTHVYA